MGRPVPSRAFCPAPNFPPFSAHCRAPHAAQILPLLSSLCLLLELGRTRLPARQPLTSNSISHCEPCGGIGSQSSQASPRIRRGCRPKLVNVDISCQRDRCAPSVRDMLVRSPGEVAHQTITVACSYPQSSFARAAHSTRGLYRHSTRGTTVSEFRPQMLLESLRSLSIRY